MINFVLSASENYAGVQSQVLEVVQSHLGPSEYTTSVLEPCPGSINFTLFIRNRADILMSHGCADKNYLFMRDEAGDKLINRFRHVLVPGIWLRNRLINDPSVALPPKNIHVVGWPRLDVLLRRRDRMDADSTPGTLRVLWAPSHDYARRGQESVSTSSYPEFLLYLHQLERDYDLTTSVHPRNRSVKAPTVLPLLRADVIISDFGTLVYEAWALGKPVIFPSWLIGERIQEFLPGSAEAEIFSKQIGLHAHSLDELLAMLRAGPVIGPDVRGFMDVFLNPARPGSSGAHIAGLLRDLACAT